MPRIGTDMLLYCISFKLLCGFWVSQWLIWLVLLVSGVCERKRNCLAQGWANYGPSNAFLWPAKNLYQAKTLPLFSFSNRLMPYKLFISM